ncbi:MAG: lipoyl(octanoyl) transferase LipB [Bacteroidota bacterium]|nr:lipoyl(octanoyl) transferase LipB [Candidatus Kapabacteria bacterium]MCX7936503.1 lipoyl(octanoyl) transferase LipB [Chlorobiota bacterium]MDW8270860.1 lipoyl(octanoyl) transferase LipB [Bacteroidota bacterium]
MIVVENWGLIEYRAAWERQREYVRHIQQGVRQSTLVLCEHPAVITVGRAGTFRHVLCSPEELAQRGIDLVETDRGGDVTLHNPGQLVGYPIFDLMQFRADLHWFVRTIEQCIIDALKHWGIVAGQVPGLTGVWVEGQRKICAIGIRCSRWVTSHGFALNVANDLQQFDCIIPCGIPDREVTSMERELGTAVAVSEVASVVADVFKVVFGRGHLQKP